MVALGGLVSRVPAPAGALRGALVRAITALGATFLIVQIFVVAAAALVWSAGVIVGLTPGVISVLLAVIAAAGLGLGAVVFTRAWAAEGRLARGLDVGGSPPA